MLNILIDFFPQSGQIVKFDYISIAFIVIIVISLIVGIVRGFASSLISLLAGLGSIILAILLAKPFGEFLAGTSLGNGLYQQLDQWVVGQLGTASEQLITTENMSTVLPEVYSALNIPSFLHQTITALIQPLITQEGVSIASVVATSITNYTFIAISFLVLWIIFLIIFIILGRLGKKINKIPVVGGLNRILGGIFGLGIGLIICFGVCYGFSFLLSMENDFSTAIREMLAIDQDNVWTFSKLIYQLNFVEKILNALL